MDVSTGVNACNTFGLRWLEDSEGISFEAEPGVHQRVLDFSGVTAAHTFESLLNQILAELSRDRNTFEAALVDMTSTLRSEVELLSKELGEQTSRHTASIHEVKHMFTEGSRMLEAQLGGIRAQVAEEQAAREEMESMMRMASSRHSSLVDATETRFACVEATQRSLLSRTSCCEDADDECFSTMADMKEALAGLITELSKTKVSVDVLERRIHVEFAAAVHDARIEMASQVQSPCVSPRKNMAVAWPHLDFSKVKHFDASSSAPVPDSGRICVDCSISGVSPLVLPRQAHPLAALASSLTRNASAPGLSPSRSPSPVGRLYLPGPGSQDAPLRHRSSSGSFWHSTPQVASAHSPKPVACFASTPATAR